jgi:Transglutaminase-like superfamily
MRQKPQQDGLSSVAKPSAFGRGLPCSRARLFSSRVRRLPLVLEACCFLTVARLAIALLPFRWITKTIVTPPAPRPDGTRRTIRNVCNAVTTAVRRLAPSAVCLPQALAGHWMLYRRGVPSVVCFGVRRHTVAALEAHAWLRAGDRAVLGEKGLAGFTWLVEFPLHESATSTEKDFSDSTAIVRGTPTAGGVVQ